MRLGIFLILAAALLAGCAGYHLGPVNGGVAREKSIEILPFNNQTLQPRLGDAVVVATDAHLPERHVDQDVGFLADLRGALGVDLLVVAGAAVRIARVKDAAARERRHAEALPLATSA